MRGLQGAPRQVHGSIPRQRLGGEIRRRTEGVGIFPNAAPIGDLVGAER